MPISTTVLNELLLLLFLRLGEPGVAPLMEVVNELLRLLAPAMDVKLTDAYDRMVTDLVQSCRGLITLLDVESTEWVEEALDIAKSKVVKPFVLPCQIKSIMVAVPSHKKILDDAVHNLASTKRYMCVLEKVEVHSKFGMDKLGPEDIIKFKGSIEEMFKYKDRFRFAMRPRIDSACQKLIGNLMSCLEKEMEAHKFASRLSDSFVVFKDIFMLAAGHYEEQVFCTSHMIRYVDELLSEKDSVQKYSDFIAKVKAVSATELLVMDPAAANALAVALTAPPDLVLPKNMPEVRVDDQVAAVINYIDSKLSQEHSVVIDALVAAASSWTAALNFKQGSGDAAKKLYCCTKVGELGAAIHAFRALPGDDDVAKLAKDAHHAMCRRVKSCANELKEARKDAGCDGLNFPVAMLEVATEIISAVGPAILMGKVAEAENIYKENGGC